MAKTKALEADLEEFKKFIAEHHNNVELPKKKELLNKLTGNQFEEVIRELFSKEKMLKFLDSTALQTGTALDKKTLEANVAEVSKTLQARIIDKIDDYEDKSKQDEILRKFGNIVLKHAKIDGHDNVSDPKVLKSLLKWFSQATDHSEFTIYPSSQYNNETGQWVSDGKCQMVDLCFDDRTELECTINQAGFDQWTAQHLLVKDLGNDMAEFELVY